MAQLPSRNRGFALYSSPKLRRALNAQRLLESLSRDLAEPGLQATIRIRAIPTARGKRYRLEYDNPALRCARTSYLTRGELEHLRELIGATNGRFRLLEEEERRS